MGWEGPGAAPSLEERALEGDADGNQTPIKTESGVWSVVYNAENRPIRWQSGDTVITMSFDRMGRRVEMRTVKEGVETLQRFVYDNNLCVQRLNAANGNAVRTEFMTHDGNKNVSEVFYHALQNGQGHIHQNLDGGTL